MGYHRSGTMTRNKYWMLGDMRAEKQGPYSHLVYQCRTYAQGTSMDRQTFHGRAKDPVDVVNGYLARAIRRGLSGEQIRCALDEAGLQMPAGVMSLGRLLTLDLTKQKDTWLRYWCHVVPRVLVAGTRGELDGADLAGRVYTEKEIKEVLHLCVTAQCEDLQLWWRFSNWAVSLYAEYTRRTGKAHKCEERLRIISLKYPSDW